jgi:hypothetical protein
MNMSASEVVRGIQSMLARRCPSLQPTLSTTIEDIASRLRLSARYVTRLADGQPEWQKASLAEEMLTDFG